VDAKYGIVFLILAGVAALVAVAGWETLGWPVLALGYTAVSFLLLAAAYFGVGPRLFAKRATGRASARGWLLFAPYFLLNFLTFRLYRAFHREPAYARLTPALYFGRRLTAREVREARPLGWVAVLDLAAEFAEVAPFREFPRYRSLPVLDATAPAEEQLREAVAWLTEAAATGPVYVHCALGHGRTACVVVAYLLAVGVVGSVSEGTRLLRSLRPGVRLNRSQRRALRPYEPATRPALTT
jgi:protein-tyrosine phosphatase